MALQTQKIEDLGKMPEEPSVDDTGKGISILATVDANATGIGAAMHCAADGHWEEADASADTTAPCTGIALTAGTGADKEILKQGQVRNDGWSWITGPGEKGLIYLSTTTGALTQTAPSGVGEIVQVVGHAITDDVMMFNPQLQWIELGVGPLADVVGDTNPQLGGDLDLNDKYISLKQEPTADDTGSGIILPSETVDENTFGIACALHLAVDGHWEMASANETTNHMPCTGIAITAGTGADKKILVLGSIRHDDWNWTTGPGIAGLIYLGETSGVLTQTAPTGGDLVQQVGHAISDDVMYFNPQAPALKSIYYTAFSELTIAAGAITVTQAYHTVDTVADGATSDLATINGGATVNLIILRAEDGARTVVVKHNTGNIWLQGKADISLDDLEDGIMLAWDGTKWFDIAAGGGGGGDVATDAIWDAAGDLVQGTGADTGARLAKGAALALPRMNAGATAIEWGSAGQIVFPASVNASANVNTLDDYEEGSWTPAYTSTSATFTYQTQSGHYVRIGNRVFIGWYMSITNVTGTTTNAVTVTGLPFTSAGDPSGTSTVVGVCNFATYMPAGYLSSTYITLRRQNTLTALTAADVFNAGTTYLIGSGFFVVA